MSSESARPGDGGGLQYLVQGAALLNLSVETPGRVRGWDVIVLTAAGDSQARLYEMQLEAARLHGGIPATTRTFVVPDPRGTRIGSGGATLNALRALAELLPGEDVRELRVLMIHAGGDSKRVPWASIFGKCFIPFPVLADNDRPVPTVFDHEMAMAAPVAEHMTGPGLMCFSGDALPLFASSRLRLPADGAVVVATPASLDVAERHGVVVAGEDGVVSELLQKASAAELTARGALVRGCAALLDTGIYAFGGGAYRALATLATSPDDPVGDLLESGAECSLYEEIAAAFVPARHEWLLTRPIGQRIHEHLGEQRLFCHRADELLFVHLGTSAEVLDHLWAGWGGHLSRRILADCGANVAASAVVCAAEVSPEATVGRGSLVMGCWLGPGVHVGARAIVAGVDAARAGLHVPDNVCLWQVPVRHEGRSETLSACCGVDDNPKDSADTGTFLNCRFALWLETHGVREEEIWPEGTSRTLWSARLFPVGSGHGTAVVAWMMMADPEPLREMLDVWRSLPRMSLSGLHASVDPEAFASAQQGLVSDLALRATQRTVDGGLDRDIASLVGQIRSGEVRGCLSVLSSEMAQGRRARGLVAESRFLRMRADLAEGCSRDAEAATLRNAAFEAVHRQVSAGVSVRVPDAVTGLDAGVRVKVELPVRFDIAGGWSDTPPYCLERPARALNLAALLDGRAPVGAEVETLDEKRWELLIGNTGVSHSGLPTGNRLREPKA